MISWREPYRSLYIRTCILQLSLLLSLLIPYIHILSTISISYPHHIHIIPYYYDLLATILTLPRLTYTTTTHYHTYITTTHLLPYHYIISISYLIHILSISICYHTYPFYLYTSVHTYPFYPYLISIPTSILLTAIPIYLYFSVFYLLIEGGERLLRYLSPQVNLSRAMIVIYWTALAFMLGSNKLCG